MSTSVSNNARSRCTSRTVAHPTTAVPAFPPELVSSIIDFVWEDCKENEEFDSINSTSLASRALCHETRRRIFAKLELRDARCSRTYSIHARVSSLRGLLQDNPRLCSYVKTLVLVLPVGDSRSPRNTPIRGQALPGLPIVVKQLRRLRRLVVEATQRMEWASLDETVQSALRAACSSGALTSISFAHLHHVPSSLLTANPLAAVRLKAVHVVHMPEPLRSGKTDVHSFEDGMKSPASLWPPEAKTTRLHIEHSRVTDLLGYCTSAFRHLRFLHTGIASTREIQHIIFAARLSLEEFSCQGKATAVTTRTAEGAAGVGPFSFRECPNLHSLHFRYATPRGHLDDFSKCLFPTLDTVWQSKADLALLKLSFQCSTERDVVHLLGSSFWSVLDRVYGRRSSASRLCRVRVEVVAARAQNSVPLFASRMFPGIGTDIGVTVEEGLSDFKESLPSLFSAGAISVSLNRAQKPSRQGRAPTIYC